MLLYECELFSDFGGFIERNYDTLAIVGSIIIVYMMPIVGLIESLDNDDFTE